MDSEKRCHAVGAAILAYNPDPARIARLIRNLRGQVDELVVFNNAPEDAGRYEWPIDTPDVMHDGKNVGIARAMNTAIAELKRREVDYVVMFDQDSQPETNYVPQLIADVELHATKSLVVVGPTILDAVSGFVVRYDLTRWGPKLRRAVAEDGQWSRVGFAATSGCLISVKALEAVGDFDESLFIDHVDLDWGLRATKSGIGVWITPNVVMAHELADLTGTIPFTRKEMSLHEDPVRDYFNVRNAILVARKHSLPFLWRVGLILTQARWIVGTVAAARGSRMARSHMMLRGICDGVRGIGGPFTKRRSRWRRSQC